VKAGSGPSDRSMSAGPEGNRAVDVAVVLRLVNHKYTVLSMKIDAAFVCGHQMAKRVFHVARVKPVCWVSAGVFESKTVADSECWSMTASAVDGPPSMAREIRHSGYYD
jgi:hypothetical protein